jgi:hypothetical protein
MGVPSSIHYRDFLYTSGSFQGLRGALGTSILPIRNSQVELPWKFLLEGWNPLGSSLLEGWNPLGSSLLEGWNPLGSSLLEGWNSLELPWKCHNDRDGSPNLA